MDLQKPTYLVDWYAFLMIERDADLETIKGTCRRLVGLYHPDKYAHLAPEFAKQAERKMTLINDAQAILCDTEKRATYDAQLLSWDGPLSRDGNPIMVIGREPMSPLRLLQGPTDGSLEQKMEALALQVSGYNKEMFRFLQRSVGDETQPSDVAPDLRAAYAAALRAKDLYLGMTEEGIARSLGLDFGGGTSGFIPGTYDHAKEVTERLAEYSASFDDTLSQQLLGLSASGVKLQLTAGSEPVEANPDILVQLRERATARFTDLSKKLEEVAVERQEVVVERLAFMEAVYVPADQPLHRQLIVAMQLTDTGFAGFCIRLENDQVVMTDELSDELLEEYMRDPPKAVANGWSLVRVEPLELMDPEELIREVVNRHFGPMLKPDST